VQIGNSVINDHTDMQGMYDFFGTHAITSNENFRKIQHYCNFSSAGSLYKECQEAMDKADTDVSVIDIYNIYGPSCFNSNLTSKPKKTSVSEWTFLKIYIYFVKVFTYFWVNYFTILQL